jgi:hypothetical protein
MIKVARILLPIFFFCLSANERVTSVDRTEGPGHPDEVKVSSRTRS